MSGRTSQLQIRVTPEEKVALKKLAARAGQNVSTYVLSRALPAKDPDLTRVLEQLGQGLDPRDGLAELVRLLAELGPEAGGDALGDVRHGGLTPLAQNLIAAIAEDVAHATGGAPPDWAAGIPPLSRPQFRWPLVSLRPHQLRRTRLALRRRNVFDTSVPAPPRGRPEDGVGELAPLAEHLALLELDVEFYFVGGAIFHQLFSSSPASARPAQALGGPDADEVAKVSAERGWPPGWVAERARTIVGPGGPPGRFLDAPHLKIFAPPVEYVLALKVACARPAPSSHDLEDLRFLLRALNLTTRDTALAAVSRYVGQRHLPAPAHDTLRRLLGG
jgi:hypothetical protein